MSFLFFFQAEDGIRDGRVTGVQTCALPILRRRREERAQEARPAEHEPEGRRHGERAPLPEALAHEALAHQERGDRKSTRLNSSHPSISYAVFCLKKKKNRNKPKKKDHTRNQ